MPGKNIEVIARGVIFDHANEALLFCAPASKEYFYLPGGHVEFGETSSKALERELEEETGRKSDSNAYVFLGANEEIFVQSGKERHEVNLYYKVSDLLGPISSQEEHISFQWIPIKELHTMNILPNSVSELCKQWISF